MVMRFSSKERAGKQVDSFKRQAETWRQAYAQSTVLRESFPQVESVVIDCTFVDPISMGTYSHRAQSFYPGAKAFFAFPCPRTLCLHGGFSLEDTVTKVLASGKTRAHGAVVCNGQMQAVDAQPVPCALQMNFTVDVRYVEGD